MLGSARLLGLGEQNDDERDRDTVCRFSFLFRSTIELQSILDVVVVESVRLALFPVKEMLRNLDLAIEGENDEKDGMDGRRPCLKLLALLPPKLCMLSFLGLE